QADRAVAGEEVERHPGPGRDLVERLEERRVGDVQVERRVGHLLAELLARVGDRVAGLRLELADRLAEADPLAADRDLRGAEVGYRLGLPDRGADALQPLLALGPGRHLGQEWQDARAQRD